MEDQVNKYTKSPDVWDIRLILTDKNFRRLVELDFVFPAFHRCCLGYFHVMRRIDAKVQNEDSLRAKGLKSVLFNQIKTKLKQL